MLKHTFLVLGRREVGVLPVLLSNVDVDTIFCKSIAKRQRPGLYRAGAETTPNFRQTFGVSLRTSFSGVHAQTAVLVSSTEVWITYLECKEIFFQGAVSIPGTATPKRSALPNCVVKVFKLVCLSYDCPNSELQELHSQYCARL